MLRKICIIPDPTYGNHVRKNRVCRFHDPLTAVDRADRITWVPISVEFTTFSTLWLKHTV